MSLSYLRDEGGRVTYSSPRSLLSVQSPPSSMREREEAELLAQITETLNPCGRRNPGSADFCYNTKILVSTENGFIETKEWVGEEIKHQYIYLKSKETLCLWFDGRLGLLNTFE